MVCSISLQIYQTAFEAARKGPKFSNNDGVIFRAKIIDVTLTSFAVSVLQSGRSLRGLDVTVIS